MTESDLKELQRGDLIRNVIGDSFVVIRKDVIGGPQGSSERIIAIREIEVSNPAEWELVAKSATIETVGAR